MSKVKRGAIKLVKVVKADGVSGVVRRGSRYAYYRKFPERRKKTYKDILFINGCALPHPSRYRVDHQIEQLQASGISSDKVFYESLNMDMLKNYRGFVFYRCPVTDVVREFIKVAKFYNKKCFFDVDDLVIDQAYTDQIDYVTNLPVEDKKLYDDGVNRMQETLRLCDYAITTTDSLKEELLKYNEDVYINRNVASNEMVSHSLKANSTVTKDVEKVILGYFSGSITHNDDFNLMLPSLIKLLDKHKNLYIKIAGILDVPESLAKHKDRIIVVGFMDWRSMPVEIAECDINLAPLLKNIFNDAKSENKWTEASLVKVVTAASNIGAFKSSIKNNHNGVLVEDNEWFTALDSLIKDNKRRLRIANNAFNDVMEHNTTISTSMGISKFIRDRLSKNIMFILPSTDISGGVNVVVKHAEILRKNGFDATLVSLQPKDVPAREIKDTNVLLSERMKFEGYVDNMVATLWTTLDFVKRYPHVGLRSYFVQGYETNFYEHGSPNRLSANSTYNEQIEIRYLTMSLWCKKWLDEKFNIKARYSSNGLNLENYASHKRAIKKNSKVKILIEGDSLDHYKNVDESFKIVDSLDKDKYEISYLSYRSAPKEHYRVDIFHNRIPPEKVGEIYASCDILIKSSLLESFSYPPLEMMATGGYALVLPNDGNISYLKDGVNCLFYEKGNIKEAAMSIDNLVSDKKLQDKLYINGLKTAKKYSWDNLEKDVINLYS